MATISTSDSVELHFTDDGDGRPVVLIAGFSAPAESWEFQRRALLAEGHRVITLDRRSHGRSQSPAYGQRMARHGKDVWDVLTALDLHDVVLVGGRVSVPSLFLAGRDSQLWPCEHAELAAATNPRASVVVVEDAGHAVNIDQPEATNAALLEFLK